jgi:hypothetical protein
MAFFHRALDPAESTRLRRLRGFARHRQFLWLAAIDGAWTENVAQLSPIKATIRLQ